MAILLSILLSFSLCLGACTQNASQPAVAPPIEPEPEPTLPSIDPVVLHALLDEAELAFAAEQITYPSKTSAYGLYQQILALEPDQEDAMRGLERIVELFVAQAEQAIERRSFATARSMLSRARLILPNHASIKPTGELLRLMSEADRTKLNFNQADLKVRGTHITQQLVQLATDANISQCRYVIYAKNDAQGRWIYQQLASAVTSARVRAQIRIRLPASVERLCFTS